MSNVLDNTVFISQLLVFLMVFSVIISIFVLVNTEIRTTLMDMYDFSYLGDIYYVFDDVLEVLQTGIHFLTAFLIAISLLTSAIERQTITSYMIRFIVVLLFSSTIVFVLSQLVTNFMGGVPEWIEFSYMPTWFLNNWSTIIMLNILAFLSGFIFVKVRGVSASRGVTA